MKYLLAVFISLNFLLLLITGCSNTSNSNSASAKSGEMTTPEAAFETTVPATISSSLGTTIPGFNQPAITISTPSITTLSTPVVVENQAVGTPSPTPTITTTIIPIPPVQPSPTSSENIAGNVNSNGLTTLQGMKTLKIKTSLNNVFALWNPTVPEYRWGAPSRKNVVGPNIETIDMPISWNGTSFSGYWHSDPIFDRNNPFANKISGQATIGGSVSNNATMIVSLEYVYDTKEYYDKVINSNYNICTRKITLQNVPIDDQIWGFEGLGNQIKDYIVFLEYIDRNYYKSQLMTELVYVSTDWSSKDTKMSSLSVQFSPISWH